MEAEIYWSLEIKKNIKALLLIGHFKHNAENYEFQGPVQVLDIWKQTISFKQEKYKLHTYITYT